MEEKREIEIKEINFKSFVSRISEVVEVKEGFEQEWYHDWYVDFKESNFWRHRENYEDPIKSFAEFWFVDVSFETHDYQIKK